MCGRHRERKANENGMFERENSRKLKEKKKEKKRKFLEIEKERNYEKFNKKLRKIMQKVERFLQWC